MACCARPQAPRGTILAGTNLADVPSACPIAELRAWFDRADTDHSNWLSLAELNESITRGYLEELATLSGLVPSVFDSAESFGRHFLSRAEKDDDKMITFDEFLQLVCVPNPKPAAGQAASALDLVPEEDDTPPPVLGGADFARVLVTGDKAAMGSFVHLLSSQPEPFMHVPAKASVSPVLSSLAMARRANSLPSRAVLAFPAGDPFHANLQTAASTIVNSGNRNVCSVLLYSPFHTLRHESPQQSAQNLLDFATRFNLVGTHEPHSLEWVAPANFSQLLSHAAQHDPHVAASLEKLFSKQGGFVVPRMSYDVIAANPGEAVARVRGHFAQSQRRSSLIAQRSHQQAKGLFGTFLSEVACPKCVNSVALSDTLPLCPDCIGKVASLARAPPARNLATVITGLAPMVFAGLRRQDIRERMAKLDRDIANRARTQSHLQGTNLKEELYDGDCHWFFQTFGINRAKICIEFFCYSSEAEIFTQIVKKIAGKKGKYLLSPMCLGACDWFKPSKHPDRSGAGCEKRILGEWDIPVWGSPFAAWIDCKADSRTVEKECLEKWGTGNKVIDEIVDWIFE